MADIAVSARTTLPGLLGAGLIGAAALTGDSAAPVAALAALVGVLAFDSWRAARSLRRNERDGLTDDLTGLRNRRALVTDLDRALAATPADEPALLALFDLDGFKHYNDAHGHAAGDELLRVLGGRLAVAIGDRGAAYRLGGDEFCVLARGPQAREAIHRAAEGLRDQAAGITASRGQVELPGEAAGVTEALRLADRRLDMHKERRPTSPARQTRDVLMRTLAERAPELLGHANTVSALAVQVSGELGLGAEEGERIAQAAELHAIGKLGVPDAILAKTEPLTGPERDALRRETVAGEAIIAAAPALRPVADIVRATHERVDGRGGPHGLAGDAIPLGARVIAACDAYASLRAAGVQRGQAVAALRARAGSELDPAVVAAFVRVHDREYAALPRG